MFGLYGMELQQIVPVGGGNHLRLLCAKKGVTISCMKFGTKPEDFPFVPGEVLDLAVTLEAKEFRGEPQLTVSVREVKLSGLDMDQCVHERRLVALLGGEERKSAEILPTQGKVDIFASPVFQRAEALVGKQG